MSVYYKFSQAKHGACNAHILRELWLDGAGLGVGSSDTHLLELHHWERPLRRKAALEAQKRYRQILRQAEMEDPPPDPQAGRERPKSTPGRNLLRRLQEHEEAVLAFALVEGMPFTNNQAERDLRPLQVKHKVSGGFRTDQGAKVYARLQGGISTCRKQEQNVYAILRALFAHRPVSLLARG